MLIRKPFALTDKEDALIVRNRILNDLVNSKAGYKTEQQQAKAKITEKFKLKNSKDGFTDKIDSVMKSKRKFRRTLELCEEVLNESGDGQNLFNDEAEA